ncbi:hypothetical protein T484DRAFT_1841499 [Baffinella frigidus]|nr:hypothetical protein T484DRAFT_1841499 [Cryptophyta sp. CCMP2293]
MPEHRLDWSCEEDMASCAADAAIYRTLMGMSSDELVRRYGAGECPTMAGLGELSRLQGTNLLRHVLRERMSPYKFNHLPGMGSQEGALKVAEAFEGALQEYLGQRGVPFLDEAEQKKKWIEAQAEGINRLPRVAFAAAGIDGQGRQLYAGLCAECGGACTVPFKPVPEKSPPRCRDCLTPLLTPDILFTEPTFINGRRIHWLDCKAFYGSPNILSVCASLAEQARKYGERWGPGGFVFACGFAENLAVECPTGAPILLGTACLDMRQVRALVEAHLGSNH